MLIMSSKSLRRKMSFSFAMIFFDNFDWQMSVPRKTLVFGPEIKYSNQNKVKI